MTVQEFEESLGINNADQQKRAPKDQDAILIAFDHRERLLCLTIEQRGILITALYEHYCDGEIKPGGECKEVFEDPLLWVVLDGFVKQSDRYLKRSNIRSIAGKMGGAPKGNQNAKKK